MPARDLHSPSDEHLQASAADLLKTVEVRYASLLPQWPAQWQRHQESRSRRLCKSPLRLAHNRSVNRTFMALPIRLEKEPH